MKSKTFYYTDELKDDFAGLTIRRKPISGKYRYVRKNPVWHFCSFLLYRVIATPVVFVYTRLWMRERIVGRKKIRKWRKDGYFLYGNHTMVASDVYTPSMISFPKKCFILANSDAFSLPVVGTMADMLGGMPVPDKRSLYKPYMEAMERHCRKGHVVMIYPEAHIWPYYTDIRNFPEDSFKYPALHNKPMFVVTRTFQKRRIGKRPRSVVYVDGPFLPDADRSVPENRKLLRDKAYETMKRRSAQNTYAVHNYVKLS